MPMPQANTHKQQQPGGVGAVGSWVWTPPQAHCLKTRSVSHRLGRAAFRRCTWDSQCFQPSFSPPCSPVLTDKFIATVSGQMSPFIWDATRPTPPVARVQRCSPSRRLRGVGDVWPCLSRPLLLHPTPLAFTSRARSNRRRGKKPGRLRAPWPGAKSTGCRCPGAPWIL